MKRLLAVLLFLCSAALGQTQHTMAGLDANNNFTGQNSFPGIVLTGYTFATLPVSWPSGTLAVITDSSGTGPNCAGGGSSTAVCRFNGTSWVLISGGGGGSAYGTVQANGVAAAQSTVLNLVPGTNVGIVCTTTAGVTNCTFTAAGGGGTVNVNGSSVVTPNFGNLPAVQAGNLLAVYQASGSNVSSEIPVSGNSTQAASAANIVHTAATGTATCVDGSGNITTTGCSAPPGSVALTPGGAQTIAQPSGTDLNVTVAGTGKVALGGTLRIAGPEPFVDVNTPVAEGGVGCDPTGVTAANTCLQNAINKITATGGTIYTCGTYLLDLTASNPGILINTQNESAIRFVSCGTAADNLGTSPVRGGTIFKSTSNVAIPNPVVAPTIAANGSGSLAAATYTLKVALVNGFGETLVSPASTGVVAGANSAIKISSAPYSAGGWAYCPYWSNDGTNYFMQPAANYASSGGTFGGEPFLVGNPDGTPSLTSFTASGTAVGPCAATPPASNTSTHAGVLAQVGDASNTVNSAIEFNNIYWQDSTGVLGAGLVIASCNRCTVYHNAFEGFHANGSAMGGHATYEQGGIGLVIGNLFGVGNFNEGISNYFYDNTLDRYISASDTALYGKNECTVKSGQLCEDYTGGNLSEVGSHVDPSGSGAVGAFVWRGSQMASHLGGNLIAKVEGLASFSGPAVKMYAMQNAHVDLSYCGTNAAAAEACVVLDSTSTGNLLNIQNPSGQCAYSDGTTCLTDPSNGSNNILSSSGNVLNGTTTASNFIATSFSTGSFNLNSLTLAPTTAFPNGVLVVAPTNTGSVGAVINCAANVTVDCFDVESGSVKQFYVDNNGETHFQASDATSASFNMPFGVAPTTPQVGDFWFASPNLLEYWDQNNTLEDVAATNIQNVFQQMNTFVEKSTTSPAVVIRQAPSGTSDIVQIQDSGANPQIEFTKDFGIIANYFKTNGTVSGTQEFTATGTDPLGSFALDSASVRLDAPVSITTPFRIVLPSTFPGAVAGALLFTSGCSSQTVLSNSAITCPSSIGQIPNSALVNNFIPLNGTNYVLGTGGNLGQLNDSAGHPTIESTAVGSADFLSVGNSATGNPGIVTLTATGSDTNISVNIVSKGVSGQVLCNGSPCGGGSGGTSVAANGTLILGTTANFETSASLNGTPSTQVALGAHNGDALGVQFGADSGNPTTNVTAYLSNAVPMPHYRRTAWIEATGGSWSTLGDVQAITGTNTSAAPTATDPEMASQATTTTINANAGLTGNAVLRTGRNIHWQGYIELPDQVAGSFRAWWGLTQTTLANMNGSDTPAFTFAAFRYSTNASDTTFKCVVGNGTTTTVKDTTVTPDAAGHYFDLVFDDTTGNIQCLVDGVVKATFANTDAVPASGTNLLQIASVQTLAAATKHIAEGWMLSTSDK